MGIGADIVRVDGVDKIVGRAEYVDDLHVPGVWHGGVVRSSIARGTIRKIHFDPAINWSEFAVVDHADIRGKNTIRLIEDDQPALAAKQILHKYEPILLLAHPSIRMLRRALSAVTIETEPLAALTDPRTPPGADQIAYGRDNVFKRIDIVKGDIDTGFKQAKTIIEGEYRTGTQEHLYLETQGVLAYQEGARTTVKGSMQCPYYVVQALSVALGRPCDDFRVVATAVGGGFGGKEEYPSVLAVHAALLSEKARAPVKIVYDRQEDMAVTTKRHPTFVKHKTGLDGNGRLVAMAIEIIMDGGAYVTLSPVVLSRGTIHASGPYQCENIHAHGEVRFTNSPPYGAFRGFGAPQTLFAIERHMDEIAPLDICPVELRRRNLLREGGAMSTGQVYREGVDLPGLMDKALSLADWNVKMERHARENASHPYIRRGIGFATFHHGAGFTGSGEVMLESEVHVRGLADGTIEILTAQTDMGQGTSTILAQIASDATGLSEDDIRVAVPDTSRVPNSGPTVASRTAMVVGKLVARASEDLACRLGEASLRGAELQGALRSWHRAHPGEELIGLATYQPPRNISWDEASYRGDAYATYAWATHVAEVEVDLRTWMVRVIDYVALQDVGRVLNPTLARGQIQGGVVQGIGWATSEEVVLDDGVMKNAQLTNYSIPGCGDLPPIRVYFDETPPERKVGPGGAKGIGELPMDGPAPAIANAISRALDLAIDEIPLTPEKLMDLDVAREV